MTSATKYNDLPVKLMIYPSLIFLIAGMIIGVFMAFNVFVFPDYFSGEYIHFGKIRPIHVGHVTFLWLLSSGVGLFYFFIPRLCGVPLWSPRLACFTAAIWWLSLIVAVYSYPFGTNFGWEYAEIPNTVWYIPVKPLFVLAWVLVSVNLFATIFNRKYKQMYVSVWYVMGTLIWTTFIYIAGSYAVMWVPGGISRVNISWFYVHNIVGLIFTPMGLAAVYYFLPKTTDTPIYSHRLSMIGFWSIAFIYGWIGAHHMIHGPISQWLQTISIIFSILMFIPVWTVVFNLFSTLLPKWKEYTQSAAVRFLMMGVMFYFVTCIQGPVMALRNVNEITSKTDWVIGHAHVALYGAFTFFATGAIYYVIPIITKKPLWSERLADVHFTLSMFGSILFMMALQFGGFYQGLLWSHWADGTTYAEFHSQLTSLSFLQTVAQMHPFWIMRAVGGLIILISNLLFVGNMFNTIVLKKTQHLEVAA
ncbi:cytochrome c oxidase subunit 1 homolog,bacteroid [Waddlia chondrophila 2032/99]|uniref:Cytochrome c oxidase subunit 1 homolog,bacteroid n=2 Tax=Waddlia chondrophila TaxID=71667 RepID=F8LAP2_9BACT|nr:cbb3-type cytochrome c oxidase subunit I [Waddlia chondrophila]ADI39298.1 putative cytochrome c oxidase, subunit I [Waddlia chondrophila WSU 86-1044]CCB90553.1 cytochrome c oxidase subunit 1 homolog,bacteroid [Waddlia chondrophila 2032/99]